MKKALLFGLVVLMVLSTGPARGDDPPPAPVKKMKPALLVIDVQNEFLPYMDQENVRTAPFLINGAIWLFRERALPIIREIVLERGLMPEAELEEAMRPEHLTEPGLPLGEK